MQLVTYHKFEISFGP